MMATLATIVLQAAPPAGPARSTGPDLPFFFMIAALFLIFYLLVFRPQQRRQKEQDALLKAVEKGDQVVTSGGIHGRVVGTTDDVLTLEIDDTKGVRLKIDRRSVDRRLAKAGDAKKEGGKK